MNDAGSITDVSGIRVGHWTDRRAAAGVRSCCPIGRASRASMFVARRRKARETDLLRPGNLVQHVHAICLAGGSAFGLDAASGVMRYLSERGIGYPYGRGVIADRAEASSSTSASADTIAGQTPMPVTGRRRMRGDRVQRAASAREQERQWRSRAWAGARGQGRHRHGKRARLAA
jgi:L-aminopeptidase/D-esterase-like protein